MQLYMKMKVIVVSSLLLLVSSYSDAKVRAITSRREFEQNIAKKSMVVAFFYNDKNKDRMRMFDDLSAEQSYNDADVMFLKINAARKELNDLAALYGIKAMPALIFFNHGKRLMDGAGKVMVLSGAISRDMLQSVIDKQYGTEIKQLIAGKNAVSKKRLEEEGESWREYFYPRTINVKGYGTDERVME